MQKQDLIPRKTPTMKKELRMSHGARRLPPHPDPILGLVVKDTGPRILQAWI